MKRKKQNDRTFNRIQKREGEGENNKAFGRSWWYVGNNMVAYHLEILRHCAAFWLGPRGTPGHFFDTYFFSFIVLFNLILHKTMLLSSSINFYTTILELFICFNTASTTIASEKTDERYSHQKKKENKRGHSYLQKKKKRRITSECTYFFLIKTDCFHNDQHHVLIVIIKLFHFLISCFFG